MCGIVGYIGEKKATPILLNGLKNLEYRGYDSAGIAVIENNHIEIRKEIGRVKNLENIINSCSFSGTLGIAHTRWATHGEPSKQNAHPHQDNSLTFAVVHNGIIENEKELHHFLEEHNYSFSSQTDTEVIPNLIHYHYSKKEKTKDNFLTAVHLACQQLKGSYALLVVCKDFPKILIAIRKDSPLVIGKNEKSYYIASDIPAILEYTQDFYFLEEKEIALIQKDYIQFFDDHLLKKEKQINHTDLDSLSNSKNGYEDFMLKEIYEQPMAIRKTISNKITLGKITNFSDLSFSRKELSSFKQIYIVACGTAMHAGLVGKKVIEKLCKIPVSVEIASEFRYMDPLIDNHTLCIFISQSGETADTIAALKLAKQKGSTTLVISNVLGSSITREADHVLYTYAGPEIAVASTKAYSCQVVLICTFSIYMAEILERIEPKEIEYIKKEILDLPEKIELVLQNQEKIKELASKIYTEHDMFFLGRGLDYYIALEASLKMKEISYIHSEAYPAGELKHGPIALIENGSLIIGILTQEHLVEKTISNLYEVISRGARTFIISNQDLLEEDFNFVLKIPKVNPVLSSILAIIPLQLLSYYIAKEKGLDVDKPRNLAKSVTVE